MSWFNSGVNTFSMVSSVCGKRITSSYQLYIPCRPFSSKFPSTPSLLYNRTPISYSYKPLDALTDINMCVDKSSHLNPSDRHSSVWKCNKCKMTNERPANSQKGVCFCCGEGHSFESAMPMPLSSDILTDNHTRSMDSMKVTYNTTNIGCSIPQSIPMACLECGLIDQYDGRCPHPNACKDCKSLKLARISKETLAAGEIPVSDTTVTSALDLIEELPEWESRRSSFPYETKKRTHRKKKGASPSPCPSGNSSLPPECESSCITKNKEVTVKRRPLYPPHVLSLFNKENHDDSRNSLECWVPLSLRDGILKTTVTDYKNPVFVKDTGNGEIIEEISTSTKQVENLVDILKKTKNAVLATLNDDTDNNVNDPYKYSDEVKRSISSPTHHPSNGIYNSDLAVNGSSIRTIEVRLHNGDLDRIIYNPSVTAAHSLDVLLPEDVWRSAWGEWGRDVILQKAVELISMHRKRDSKRPYPACVKQQLQMVIWGLLEGIEVRIESIPLPLHSSAIVWRCPFCDLENEQESIPLLGDSSKRVCYACGKDEETALRDRAIRRHKMSKIGTDDAEVYNGEAYSSVDGWPSNRDHSSAMYKANWLNSADHQPNSDYGNQHYCSAPVTNSYPLDNHNISTSSQRCLTGWSTEPYHSWTTPSGSKWRKNQNARKLKTPPATSVSPPLSVIPTTHTHTPITRLGKFLSLGEWNCGNNNTFGNSRSSLLPPKPVLDLSNDL
eukprot:Tbor_TRINITY_DN3454_c0_g1::TRINITY_DN3454_c0_g1_i1::g.3648::m.3648